MINEHFELHRNYSLQVFFFVNTVLCIVFLFYQIHSLPSAYLCAFLKAKAQLELLIPSIQ